MPLITETYYLSLTQDNRGILRLRCSQNDTLRTANLKLYNNGSTFTIPSGISAYVSGVKQNGAVFSKSCTISQDRKSVVLQLSSDITNVDGIIVAEIVLNDGNGDRLGTSNFIIQVEKNPIRAGVIQDTETPIEYVNDFITQIQALTARVNNLITPNGDPSLAEVVDARISSLDGNTYQNLKARIDADVATLNTRKANKSEVYTKSQVDDLLANVEIDVDDELSDESENPVQNKVVAGAISEIKADLGAQTGIISLMKDCYIRTSDTPINLTPIPSSIGRMCAVVDCTAGDKFVINAYSDSTPARAWCFIDNTNNALSMADALEHITNLELTAPANASKLIINDISGGMSYKVGNNLANWIGGSGLSQNARAALLACLEHVAWIDEHGQTYYNALEDALYPNRYWDYEWDATSGVAPSSYFSSYEHDFTKYPDAMYADNFYFDFDHVGDVDILFVAKMADEAAVQNFRTPQISVRCAQGSSGYNGFKVVFNTPSGKVETNLSGDFVSTNIDYTNYHEYRTKYENGVGYLYVDGILVAQGTGVTNNQYIYVTGIFASAMGENGHPNISMSIPYSIMAIKSVKYKGLS